MYVGSCGSKLLQRSCAEASASHLALSVDIGIDVNPLTESLITLFAVPVLRRRAWRSAVPSSLAIVCVAEAAHPNLAWGRNLPLLLLSRSQLTAHSASQRMGIFHKKDKSPSGFFTVDESDAHHPEPKRESTSTSSPRASTDSPSAAAAAKGELRNEVPASRETQHAHHDHDDERREGSVNTLAGEGVLAAPAPAAAGAAGAAAAGAPSSHATAAAAPEPAHAQSQALPAGAAGPAPSSSSAPRGLASTPAAASAGGDAPARIRETAAAPHGHHEQPRHDAVLSEEQAKLAQHDHKYLQPVVRASSIRVSLFAKYFWRSEG